MTCVNTSCVKFIKLCQSYPRINTGGHPKTPLGGVDRPDGPVYQHHKAGWKAGPVLNQLGKDKMYLKDALYRMVLRWPVLPKSLPNLQSL